jgi:hypothetical protein
MRSTTARLTRLVLVAGGTLALAGCTSDPPSCADCNTVVVAAISEPETLLPPLVGETVGRDIGDQVFERLANLEPGAAPIESSAFADGKKPCVPMTAFPSPKAMPKPTAQ